MAGLLHLRRPQAWRAAGPPLQSRSTQASSVAATTELAGPRRRPNSSPLAQQNPSRPQGESTLGSALYGDVRRHSPPPLEIGGLADFALQTAEASLLCELADEAASWPGGRAKARPPPCSRATQSARRRRLLLLPQSAVSSIVNNIMDVERNNWPERMQMISALACKAGGESRPRASCAIWPLGLPIRKRPHFTTPSGWARERRLARLLLAPIGRSQCAAGSFVSRVRPSFGGGRTILYARWRLIACCSGQRRRPR